MWKRSSEVVDNEKPLFPNAFMTFLNWEIHQFRHSKDPVSGVMMATRSHLTLPFRSGNVTAACLASAASGTLKQLEMNSGALKGPSDSGRRPTMEIAEEELMTPETEPAETNITMEAWPIPPEDETREFEEFLMEIGLRF